MTLRVGSMFAGYGGLDLGVETVLDASLAWVAEKEAAPSRILAHRFPDAPNLGDVTTVDWSRVEPVDVITAGSPCQDLSNAGVRRGMSPGTRSGLWAAVARAVDTIRPSLLVWENVRGALSARAASDLQPCPRCLGDTDPQSAMRALGRVLADLALLRYDACWIGLPASGVGACHQRFRVFVAAVPADADGIGWGASQGPHRRKPDPLRVGPQPGVMLPTPAVNDMGEGKSLDWWDQWTAAQRAKHRNGNGHGNSLAIEAQRMLPTPTAADAEASGSGARGVTLTDAAQRGRVPWGIYAEAVARAEAAVGRPAPPPTEGGRLSPRFVEWMMMLPAGWVVDTPGISRAQALKALGNGVVPAQAAAAVAHCLDTLEAVA